MRTGTVFLDGKFLKGGSVLKHRLTPGVIRERGVFETMRVYGGKIFLREEHFKRLYSGLKLYRIRCPYSTKKFIWVLDEVIGRNNFEHARIRLAVWRDKKVHTAVVTERITTKRSSCRATVSSCIRPRTKYSHVKSIDHYLFRQALHEAKDRGYDEAILLNSNGCIVEGATANIFLVKDNVLFTPSVKNGCLNGITRNAVLALARRKGRSVLIKTLKKGMLFTCDEIFITNSLWGIVPVVAIDQYRIGTGRSGPVTESLRSGYQSLIKEFLEKV